MRLTYFGPGLFAAPEGPVVVNSRTGGLVTAATPARPGDVLVMYATGLGPTLYDPATGNGASLTQLSPSLFPVVALFRGDGRDSAAEPLFSGLAPGFIGVMQINIIVPDNAPRGAVKLLLQSAELGGSPPVDFWIE